MFFEQLTNLWAQISSKPAAGWTSNPQVAPKRAVSIHGETSLDAADDLGPTTEPYVPTKSERLGELSLHLSC